MQYKLKHRISAALMAGAMCCTMIPAASAEEISTPEIADTFVPEITDSVTPDLSQITENLYNDLPDAPTGSYLGSMGLPVATGETKISISSWGSDLYDGEDAHMDADALNADESNITVGKTPDANYAVVPLLVQTEYPADGAASEIILPDGVELLSYASTDYDLISANKAELAQILHQTYAEQSAAATGFYVKASADFTAQFVYTAPDGEQLQKSIHVQLSEDSAPTQLYADNGIATLAAGPTPPYATGKITSIAKEGGTWLIWFNGQEAYCCSHGLNGQPKGCPTYGFSHVSRLEPGQYTPGNHYANQVNIWGGLGQLSLDMLDSKPVVMSADAEQPDLISEIYDETQQWIIENYPDSYAAQTYVAAAEELESGVAVQSGENGYYTYIYNPPAGYAWQVVALVGEEIAGGTTGGTEIPDIPSVPEPQYYSAEWTAPAQSASGSFDLTFTVNTDKHQQNTLEKVDGAVITITPSQTGGSVDGGSWQMTPAGAQTITTSGHTLDDNYHLNGGDGSATWTVHYEVSKTSTSTISGQEGPFTSQAEADAAAEAAKNAAINQLKNEAQGMVDAAIASARAQLANITFSYDEITIPHGFDSTPGALGSHQLITVPASSSNDYQMQNDEWSVKVSIDKIDSETKQQIHGDAEFAIFEWDTVLQRYIPTGGYNQYKVERQSDGTYKVINHSDYAGGSDDLFYTQRNEGRFVIVEKRAPNGYYGDWTDVANPGTAGSVLGKRAYAFEITKALDGQTIQLGNADYNADVGTANEGGTLIDTGEGIVSITFGDRNGDKAYNTDPTDIASNEKFYTVCADVDTMQNDRALGSITLSKVDLDAARSLAAGSNGDSTLEGAVYDLYAAEDIHHPDGVSGIVDYSKITDSSGNPIWHTTVLTNGAWKSDYLPVLKKDHLVASATIKDGKLAFANLYLGRYYLVERATGIAIPVDSNGQYYLSGQYPLLNKKLEPTGSYAALASNGAEYTDYVYRNQYSAVAESRALDGSKTYDGYYLSFAKGYLCDEVNHYQFLTYADESTYVVRTEDQTQDEVLKSGFSLQKLVSTTGQPSPAIKLGGAGFKVYRVSLLSKADQFTQNADGSYDTASILDAYFNDRQYNVVFELTSDRVYQVSGGSADGMDDYVITESYYNHETLGQIKIRKIGNVLTGYENGQFVYESDNLANATYEIHAQGDIPTPDNQGTLWYADGDLVATVTTAKDGQVDEVRFSPTRTTATYDFLKVTHDGTKGEVTITLPLGTYTISEVQAPYGFVHTDHTYTVVLDWDNQYNDLVLAKAVTDHTQDGDVIYDYSIINVGNASAEQVEKQVLVFENARVLPVVEEGKVGVGLYKLDRDTCDLTDEAPYADGCKTRVSLLNGGSNRADIPADAKMVAGAVYELYTADDIYSISGKLLAAADTLLGTATTDENGLAYFDVDVPLRGEHYGSSDAHDWTTNSGRYYLREVSVPDGYLIEQSVIPVEFTYENQFIAWQIVDCLHSDKQTTVEIDKRAFISDSDDTFALPGATLTVTDWNGNMVDTWESGDTAHVIRGLHLSHDFAGNRDTTKIYTLTETRPADGYTTARSIRFRLEQATDDNGYLQETAVWVLRETEDAKYQSGNIISPTAFSDDTVATIPAKLRAFWDKLMGKNPDADGVVIANWYCVNATLVVNFTNAANDRAIAKCLRESDFSDLAFDKVYLTGAAAPAFFADKQVADKPTDAEITYSASWILLKDSDGFSQTVTMLDAPTRVKISKADITTHEEIPGAKLRVLDKDGNVVDEWVSEDTPYYMEAMLAAGETYTLEETLVPDGSGYVPANAVQFTVEDDGKIQHVFMQDDYTKVQISKTDIVTGKEISGAKLKITDANGKTIAEWVTDGTPHYMERIPMGTYTLTETMAPTEQGYVRVERVTFEVGPTGDIQRVEMKDDFTKVEISKADMTDGHELPGAKLKITNASGCTIAEWETNGQPHRIERLKPGEYTLTETAAPAGYLLSEEVHFTVQETGEIQKVTMYDAPAHALILTKRDIATNAKLTDARLTIRDAYGTTIDRWTTTDGDHAIRVLPERSAAKDPHKNLLLLSDDTSEHVYTMVEELAPDGYLVAESITFKVMQMNDALVVFIWQDGGWQKSSEGYLAMYDERTDTPVPLMKTFPQTGSIL